MLLIINYVCTFRHVNHSTPTPGGFPNPCDIICGISQTPTTSSECTYIEEKCQTPHPAVTNAVT